MKFLSANDYSFCILSAFLSLATFMAHAHIENTMIVNYNLATGENTHYELIVSPPGENTTVTFLPIEQSNSLPSIFKVSTCIKRNAGTAKQGEFHFSSAETDHADRRLSNLGAFVNEHNLHMWLFHLDTQQNLLFNTDSGGLLVLDPTAFTSQAKSCQHD